MKISAKQYAKAFFSEVKGKSQEEVLKVVDNFFSIIKKDNCFSKTEKIIYYFNDLWNKEYNLVEAEISVSRKLEDSLKDKVVGYLISLSGTENINISEKEDSGIIGGFILKYNNKIMDASIKNKINSFKNNLLK